MKKLLLAGLAFLAIPAATGAARAADLPATTSYDWSGFYIGVNAGGLWDNNAFSSNRYSGTDWTRTYSQDSGSSSGFTGGGMMGYNWQASQFVLGLEADINYGALDGSITNRFTGPEGDARYKASFQTDWFGTLRGRAGFAVDNLLIYGTGGLAYGNLDTRFSGLTVSKSDNYFRAGWTAGAGVEYGFDKWSVGAEYLYTSLPGVDWTATFPPSSLVSKDELRYDFSTVRATLKYHF